MNIKENKGLKPALIIVVVIVWGAIVVKAISMFSNNDGPDIVMPSNKDQKSDYSYSIDTFKISANYRDPFLNNRARFGAPTQAYYKSKKDATKKQFLPKPVKTPCKWPQIQFRGIIQNKSSSNITGLVQINGKKTIINQGSEINELKFSVITKDSIVVHTNDCSKSFYRK